MKKIILIIILSYFIIGNTNSQSVAYDSININNINAWIWADNVNFWDHQGDSKYSVNRQGNSVKTMFSQSLIIGGKDSVNNIHLSYDMYLSPGTSGFQVGPISNIYDAAFNQKWNNVWKINRATIDSFIQLNGSSNYSVPDVIKNWPAHGDITKGESAQLAPFYDINSNGIYEYTQGDYPLIKGDQAIYYIFNDDTITSNSTIDPLKVEIHAMVYAYKSDCDTNSALGNTIFTNYRIINRSNNTYYNTYLNTYSDIDIGHPYNDRLGCDVSRGAYFAYNNDTTLGDTTLVAQAVVILEGPYMNADGVDNPIYDQNGIQMCDESINGSNFGDFNIDNERFGLTRFIASTNKKSNYSPTATDTMTWLEKIYFEMDGSLEIYYGSQGYDSTLSPQIACNFMYPGLSDSCYWGTGGIAFPNGQNWIESNSVNNPSYDCRANGISGDFTFEPNQIVELDIAMVTAFSDTATVMVGVSELMQAVDTVRYYYKNSIYPCGGTFLDIPNTYEVDEPIGLSIYPNPASTSLFLEYGEDLQNADYIIYDITGRNIISGKTTEDTIHKIEINEIHSGLYIIVVEYNSKRIAKKFIVR